MKVASKFEPEDIAAFPKWGLLGRGNIGDIAFKNGVRFEVKTSSASFEYGQFGRLLEARTSGEIESVVYWFGRPPASNVAQDLAEAGVDWYLIPGGL